MRTASYPIRSPRAARAHDFDGSRIQDKNVPHHDSIPLNELVYVRVTAGSDSFEDEFKSPINSP